MQENTMSHGNKPTRTLSFKTLARQNGLDSAAGVVLHGFWRMQRKRRPTLRFDGETDPRRAYLLAINACGFHPNEVTGVMLRGKFDHSCRLFHALNSF
jgi:hypothetical protein